MAGRKLLKASLNAEVTTQKLLGDKGYVVLSLSVSVAWQVIVINFFFFGPSSHTLVLARYNSL
jgi:hypothetical protein